MAAERVEIIGPGANPTARMNRLLLDAAMRRIGELEQRCMLLADLVADSCCHCAACRRQRDALVGATRKLIEEGDD